MKRTLLGLVLLALLLGACAPANATPASSGDGVVRAVLFYTPGCASCEKAMTESLAPLEAKYGTQVVFLRVPLNDLQEIDKLYSAADFFKVKAEQVMTPFMVIGSNVLIGDTAIKAQLETYVQSGLKAGGWALPAMPAQLAELVARPTPTPRATVPALVPGSGLTAPTSAPDPGACVINTPCPTAKP